MRLHRLILTVAGLAAVRADARAGLADARQSWHAKLGFLGHLLAAAAPPAATTTSTSGTPATATTSTSTSTSTAATPATTASETLEAVPTHTIAVGATGFTFTPNSLTVSVGTVVEFNFYPGNHSVVRSAFQFPCIPYEDTGANRVGFFSGFLNTNVYSSDGPKYRVRVNSSEPIFYYCAAPGSCITQGMLGVINPNASWTLEAQQAYAANTTIQLAPGDPLPSEMAPGAATPTDGPASSPSSPATAGGASLSRGAVAGIVIGSLAGALALFFAAVFVGHLRRSPQWQQRRLLRRYQRSAQGGGGRPADGNPLVALSPAGQPGTPLSAPAAAAAAAAYKFGSPVPGHAGNGLPPSMADMSEYFAQPDFRHRTPPAPPMQAAVYPYSSASPHGMPLPGHPQHPQHPVYIPGLPIFSSMATVPPHGTASPLQRHPTFSTPSPFPDKDYYNRLLHGPLPPPQQQQQQSPVELPTALTTDTAVPAPAWATAATAATAAAAPPPDIQLHATPPPAPKESPTIGSVDRAWGGKDPATGADDLAKI